MSTHDMNIANQAFPAFRSDLNNALAALVSNSSSATEPTTTFAHQYWVDTSASPSVVKIRNLDNDAWVTIGTIDESTDTFTPSGVTADKISEGNSSVEVVDSGTGSVTTTVDNVEFIKTTAATTVFNETGADHDVRIEGDTDANLLYVDAGADRVGIGTSSPSNKLAVTSTGASIGVRSTTSGQAAFVFLSNTADSTNNIIYATGNELGVWQQDASANSKITFKTQDTERMRIDFSGNLLVGATTTVDSHRAFIKQAAAAPVLALQCTGSDFQNMATFYNAAGTIKGSISSPSSSAVAYNTSSDYRLKENIAPMSGALAKVQQLKPCTYTWKDSGQAWEGFIAHEVAEVIPNAVTGEKDAVDADGKPIYQGIDTSFLVATLTAAIQEQQAIIESLKSRLDAAGL